MKNPFEKVFQPKEPSPEQAEQLVKSTLTEELRNMSVDNPDARKACIRNAYKMATELNTSKKLGLTRNRILNLLRQEAILARVPEIDIELYKDTDGKIKELINQEIENISKEEQDKPQ